LLDVIGDITILNILYKYKHFAWASLSVLFMFAPYLISFCPLMKFLLDKGNFQPKSGGDGASMRKCFACISLTPLVFIYLIGMDIIFIIITVLIYPMLWLINKITCGKIRLQNSTSFDKVY